MSLVSPVPVRWVIALVLVGVAVGACSPPEDAPTTGPEIVLEAAEAPGEAPFSASVVAADHDPAAVATEVVVARTVEITDAADVDPVTGANAVPGDAPGLYGGSGELSVCDAAMLVEFLEGDDTKASAWGAVLGVEVDEIGTFVAGLIPVVLTVDTLVTNHGFADGVAQPHQSVLQAGTAVMLDRRGTPAVRCACGNPLRPAALDGPLTDAQTSGTAWEGLDLERVVTVGATAADVDVVVVTDLESGALVDLTVPGATAGIYLATSSNHAQVLSEPEPWAGSIQSSPDGVTWTVALETTPMLDIATGDGLAVAVGLDDAGGGAIHTSTDGTTWSPAIGVVDPLTAVAFGDGTWLAVGDRSFAEEGGAGDASSGAIYRSDDGATWERVATTDPYENAELASSGEILYQSMTSVGYGDGTWIATATECAYRSCMRVLFTSTDTRTWTRMALGDDIVEIEIAHDGTQWGFVGGEAMPDPPDNASIDRPIGAAGTSADGLTWSIGPTAPDRIVLTGLNPGDDEWLAVPAYVPAALDDPPPGGGIYRSTDILTWELIGTADPWTTSVALLTASAAAPPVAETETQVGTVRVRTAGLELLAPDGTVLSQHPYAEPAASAIAAVTEALGTASSQTRQGDGYCSADSTVLSWGGLQLVHAVDDAESTDWSAFVDDAAGGGGVVVDGPDGVSLGDRIEEVRAAHPDAVSQSFDDDGVVYDYVYLDDDGEMGVEVGAQDGVVATLLAPVYLQGDC